MFSENKGLSTNSYLQISIYSYLNALKFVVIRDSKPGENSKCSYWLSSLKSSNSMFLAISRVQILIPYVRCEGKEDKKFR